MLKRSWIRILFILNSWLVSKLWFNHVISHFLLVWNSLLDSLCDPAVKSERFMWDLKTHFCWTLDTSALQVLRFHGIVLNKSTFTYLLSTRSIHLNCPLCTKISSPKTKHPAPSKLQCVALKNKRKQKAEKRRSLRNSLASSQSSCLRRISTAFHPQPSEYTTSMVCIAINNGKN